MEKLMLMHAVQYNSYGGGPASLKHVEVPLPIPSKDEVLIKLEAASVNPFDWKVQKGMLWPLLPPKFPYIPCNFLSVRHVVATFTSQLSSIEKLSIYTMYRKHVEVPLPIPSKDEVLIKLEAASVNPFDWKVQKGMLWPLLPPKFPYIPCNFLSVRHVVATFTSQLSSIEKLSIYTMYRKHVEVPLPIPSKDEVLIKLEAASVNPFDWKVQKGMLWPLLPPKFPYIPCTDIAGEVKEIGEDVTMFKPGDKVVGFVSPFTGGGLAEFAVVKENLTASRPKEISASECAGLPVAALTALQALSQSIGIKLDKSGERKNILITAASGGVGHYAVQLAKLGNTHVTATCGARNIEFVKSLGADEVLDYKTPEGAALKSPSGKKYDGVVHCTVDIPWSVFEPNLSMNGKVVDITPNSSSMITFAFKKLTFSSKQLVPLLLIPKGEDLQYLVDLVKEGKLRTVIDSRYSITKAEDGWARSIDGHATGKIVFEF